MSALNRQFFKISKHLRKQNKSLDIINSVRLGLNVQQSFYRQIILLKVRTASTYLDSTGPQYLNASFDGLQYFSQSVNLSYTIREEFKS